LNTSDSAAWWEPNKGEECVDEKERAEVAASPACLYPVVTNAGKEIKKGETTQAVKTTPHFY
jgi:hypothetical protein